MQEYQKHSTYFPYLVVRFMPGVYRIVPRPKDYSEERLVKEALDISTNKKIRVCVVLSPTKGIYVEPDGTTPTSDSIPAGGLIFY